MKTLLEQVTISEDEHQLMVENVKAWSAINTHSSNLIGLEKMLICLEAAVQPLGGIASRIRLPKRIHFDRKGECQQVAVGDALQVIKRPQAPLQILLAGHIDTVFEADSPFQMASHVDSQRLLGPGVADMKGGIVILLNSLRLLERSPWAKNIGWQLLLTPDEEIGSPSSEALYKKAAASANIGLIFEPSFPDGQLVSARKGSSNFVVVAKGRAAHAGRDFHLGRSAIAALAHFVVAAHALNRQYPNITLNIGHISGGESSSIVPSLAACHINVRANSCEELAAIASHLQTIARESANSIAIHNDGLEIFVHPLSHRVPKPFDLPTQALFATAKQCALELGITLGWKESGGVCDGNILSQMGLPTIDTLGAVGGQLHTFQEYIEIASLAERTRLTALMLLSWASQLQTEI